MGMISQGTGTVGSVFTGACCVGFTPILAGVTAVGAGFLINDAILFPLLALFLGLMLWGLAASRKQHGKGQPLYLGMAGGIAAFAGPWVFIPVAYAGFAAIIAANIWDWQLMRKARHSCSTEAAATPSE